MTTTQRTFKTFLNDVNTNIEAKLGLSVHDLSDHNFADYWDEDIADHPADYKNMVQACVEDILWDSYGRAMYHLEAAYDDHLEAAYEERTELCED